MKKLIYNLLALCVMAVVGVVSASATIIENYTENFDVAAAGYTAKTPEYWDVYVNSGTALTFSGNKAGRSGMAINIKQDNAGTYLVTPLVKGNVSMWVARTSKWADSAKVKVCAITKDGDSWTLGEVLVENAPSDVTFQEIALTCDDYQYLAILLQSACLDDFSADFMSDEPISSGPAEPSYIETFNSVAASANVIATLPEYWTVSAAGTNFTSYAGGDGMAMGFNGEASAALLSPRVKGTVTFNLAKTMSASFLNGAITVCAYSKDANGQWVQGEKLLEEELTTKTFTEYSVTVSDFTYIGFLFNGAAIDHFTATEAILEAEVSPVMNINGTVTEKITGQPLYYAKVEVKSGETIYSTYSDADGKYEIFGIDKADEYAVTVSLDGFKDLNPTIAEGENNFGLELAMEGFAPVAPKAGFTSTESANIAFVGPVNGPFVQSLCDGTRANVSFFGVQLMDNQIPPLNDLNPNAIVYSPVVLEYPEGDGIKKINLVKGGSAEEIHLTTAGGPYAPAADFMVLTAYLEAGNAAQTSIVFPFAPKSIPAGVEFKSVASLNGAFLATSEVATPAVGTPYIVYNTNGADLTFASAFLTTIKANPEITNTTIGEGPAALKGTFAPLLEDDVMVVSATEKVFVETKDAVAPFTAYLVGAQASLKKVNIIDATSFKVTVNVKSDSEGAVIAGNTVKLTDFYDETVSYVGTTDADGVCVFPAIPAGYYNVTVDGSANGMSSDQFDFMLVAEDTSIDFTLTLEASKPTDLLLQQEHDVVTGDNTIIIAWNGYDPDNAAASGASKEGEVFYIYVNGEKVAETQECTYTLDNVAGGSYTIGVQSVCNGASSAIAESTIEVAGEDAYAALTINVSTDNGVAADAITVTFKDEDSGLETELPMVDGKFSFAALDKAKYTITATAPGFTTYTKTIDLAEAMELNIVLEEVIVAPTEVAATSEAADGVSNVTVTWSFDDSETAKVEGYPKFVIYLDGEKVGETTELTYTIAGVADGDHTVGVQAEFASGKTSDTVTCEIATSGIADAIASGVKISAISGAIRINVPAADGQIEIVAANGMTVAAKKVASRITTVNVAPGLYIVKVNGTTSKLIVR